MEGRVRFMHEFRSGDGELCSSCCTLQDYSETGGGRENAVFSLEEKDLVHHELLVSLFS